MLTSFDQWPHEDDVRLIEGRQAGLAFRDIRLQVLPDRSVQALKQRLGFLIDEGLVPDGFHDDEVFPPKRMGLKRSNELHVGALMRYYRKHAPALYVRLGGTL
jgi:hypothetical protein